MAQVAIAETWLQHKLKKTQKDLIADPWRASDNFRLNNSALRKVKLQSFSSDSEKEIEELHIAYHSENVFSVYKYDVKLDKKEAVIENAEIMVNPENEDQIILRTEEQQIKLPFLVDDNGSIK